MIQSEIPRLSIEIFARANFLGAISNSSQRAAEGGCILVRSGSNNLLRPHIAAHRREFYLFFQLMEGSGLLTVGLHRFRISPGEMAFIHPDEIMTWQSLSYSCAGHFCLVHADYFTGEAHVHNMFRQYPHFRAPLAAVKLIEEQEARLDRCFERLYAEEYSKKSQKRAAVLLHLQVILLEAQRGSCEVADVRSADQFRHIDNFLSLLDASFQLADENKSIRLKTAGEFAEQLNMHPNYLNNIIKNHTGKTVRDHIQDRLLYEAKTLLSQTDWDIKKISHVLGFSQHAAFTAFFNKKEKRSPSIFREMIMLDPKSLKI